MKKSQQWQHWVGVTFSDSDSVPVPKFLNPGPVPGPANPQTWESDSCSDSGYNHRSNRNLPTCLPKKLPHSSDVVETVTFETETETWLKFWHETETETFSKSSRLKTWSSRPRLETWISRPRFETWSSRPRIETSKFVHFAEIFLKNVVIPSELNFFQISGIFRHVLLVSCLQIQQTKNR